jgi:hypothetical protein
MSSVRLEGLDHLVATLEGLATKSEVAAQTAARACCQEVLGVMQSQFLNGQAIGRVDDALIDHWTIRDTSSPAGAILGTNVPYAHAQEYGFKGHVSVKEYSRRPGVARKPRESDRSYKARRNKFQETERGSTPSIRVAAHSRYMNLRPRAFLRGAVAASRDSLVRIALGVWRASAG